MHEVPFLILLMFGTQSVRVMTIVKLILLNNNLGVLQMLVMQKSSRSSITVTKEDWYRLHVKCRTFVVFYY
jgi:hypothetical protein